jgi:hypothetical protein
VLSGLPDVDLIEWFQADVRRLIAAAHDRFEVDAEDFGRPAIGDPGADDLNVSRCSAGAYTPQSLQQVEDGLGTLVGHSTWQARDFAVNVDRLTIEPGYSNVDAGGVDPRLCGDVPRCFRRRLTFDTHSSTGAEPDPAVGSNGLFAVPTGNGYFENVRAVNAVFGFGVSQVGCGIVVGEEGAVEMVGATGRQSQYGCGHGPAPPEPPALPSLHAYPVR